MRTIAKERFDAVLFDLDGVLTATAKVHAACWKRLFDGYLKKRAERESVPFRPFDLDTDYPLYVDGKLRYEGARSFLESRGIRLPYGTPEDAPGAETVCGLGNLKDEMLHGVIRTEGVETYGGSVKLVRRLRADGIRTAVVSASMHCKMVLEAAGIADLFDARVDGETAHRLDLPGKPLPDTYLEAAKELGVEAARAVVVEDAISGVRSGRAGGFGLVIGVDRKGDPAALRENGADLVVEDLGELVEEGEG